MSHLLPPDSHMTVASIRIPISCAVRLTVLVPMSESFMDGLR